MTEDRRNIFDLLNEAAKSHEKAPQAHPPSGQPVPYPQMAPPTGRRQPPWREFEAIPHPQIAPPTGRRELPWREFEAIPHPQIRSADWPCGSLHGVSSKLSRIRKPLQRTAGGASGA